MIAHAPNPAMKPEAELCASLTDWLCLKGWYVHPEPVVHIRRRPKVPDMVIRRSDVLGVVEAKARRDHQGRWMGVTEDVLGQASFWRKYAHKTFIATHAPHPRYREQHEMLAQMAYADGVGVLLRRHIGAGFQWRHVWPAMVGVKCDIRPLLAATAVQREVTAAGSGAAGRQRKTDRKLDWILPLVAKHADKQGMAEKDLRSSFELTKAQAHEVFKAAIDGRIAGIVVRTVRGIRRMIVEDCAS